MSEKRSTTPEKRIVSGDFLVDLTFEQVVRRIESIGGVIKLPIYDFPQETMLFVLKHPRWKYPIEGHIYRVDEQYTTIYYTFDKTQAEFWARMIASIFLMGAILWALVLTSLLELVNFISLLVLCFVGLLITGFIFTLPETTANYLKQQFADCLMITPETAAEAPEYLNIPKTSDQQPRIKQRK